MPELRQDPSTKEWVSIAVERAKRPEQFRERSAGESERFLWHIEIRPRLTTAAGFELGKGAYINIATPEETPLLLCAAVSETPSDIKESRASRI